VYFHFFKFLRIHNSPFYYSPIITF
jgi:hypothetical protein